MGEITRMVNRYLVGEITYDQLERFWVSHPLKHRWRDQPDWPQGRGAQWGFMERHEPLREDTEYELLDAGLDTADFEALMMARAEAAEQDRG